MLTSNQVEKAKAQDKPYQLSDGNGLSILITENSKLWRLRYRFGGKQLMLSLGRYPEVSLADARKRRDDAKKILAEGKDPSQHRKDEKQKSAIAQANTFGVIAQELIEKLEAEGKSPATISKQKWFLEDLASDLTDRPITAITAAEILTVLRKAEQRGRRETAHRLRGAIGRVFRFAIATQRAENDPTYALRGALAAPIVTNRAAITDETKLGQLMVCIDEYDGWPSLRAALQYLALTMARPGEVRFMRKSEVNFIKKVWTIPASRMKMRREHLVPLSDQALDVLRSVWEASDSLVFPALRSLNKSLSENAFNSALRRMGFSKEEQTSHGFRSSASTILNERGYDERVIEYAQARLDPNEVRRTYNRAKYWNERVKLLQDWADLLDQFRAFKQQSRA